MSEHVPAWKRITIKKNQQRDSTNANEEEDDPLNITTHLATGSLTKKQKQKIIRGEDREDTDLPSNKKTKSDKKKEKLPREERDARKQNVLKDQLRYLIEFYLNKVNPKNLPDSLSSLTNVRNNYSEKFNNDDQDDDDNSSESEVIDIWKFSKQKQNWLIKHFFNAEEIPVEYDELLLSYFKELKSPAIKDRVTAVCKANVSQWNEYIDQQDEKMRRIVEGEEEQEVTKEDDAKEHDTKEDDMKEKEEKKKEEDELTPPDKRVVKRSQELLKLWQVEPLIELKRFNDDAF
ncbi:ZYRO0E03938p [Zygosaccharomyces rouxii]|uniref:ZYRO0E03938p n=2 Tax=Zygosaccharomyces rouxii TaxID=4956 RepID=C5E492_ZYGRC|nr:uncharacterized protein ZYRO0E03938g [Zygosaccharomyces rouxii]KAH9198290.1 hypothetical protein LQ764DRAFT_211667 [Zygosaccharomyces rouxii]CAQ43465.1 Uncharacterized protein YCR016W [Zygosaccharomyces rouxii]CAR30853.1 ZYRO0E03938p [Zygosaccharomyces rouxii]